MRNPEGGGFKTEKGSYEGGGEGNFGKHFRMTCHFRDSPTHEIKLESRKIDPGWMGI